MMKRLLLFFVGLMVFGYLQAQTGWIPANSNLAAGRGIGQISAGMLDNTALWAMPIDATGAIVDGFTKSLDGGVTWFPGTFNAGTGLSQLFAFDGNVCWAVFNTGATQGIYKTTNSGTTWAKQGTAFGASSFADILHFFNENDGLAMGDPIGGYFEIYTTNNGGTSWIRVPSINIPAPVSGEYGITGNYDAVGDNIWFGTNKGRVYHSVDKGYHWTVALTNFGSAETIQPEFADAMNGLVFRSYLNLGLETAIGVTTDGGVTWTTVNVNGPMYARFINYVPGTAATYVGSASAAGANGISYSTDGGYNWAPITEGYDFQATVWFDNATGWAGSIAVADRTTGGMYIYDGPPLEPFAVPIISLSTDQINAQAEVGNVDVQNMSVSNIGEADLNYVVSVVYQAPTQPQAKSVSLEGQASPVNSLSYVKASIDPNARPAAYNPAVRDNFLLHYDGNNSNAVRFSPAPTTPTVAARFPTNLTLPHAGMVISSVTVWVQSVGTNMSIKIFDMGTSSSPGAVLTTQTFTGQAQTWKTVTLDNPVLITGADVWVGMQYTQPDTLTAVPGIDAGPANANGDWLTTGVSWSRLSVGNPDLNCNWNIRANLTGTPMVQWLSVAPASGTVTPGNSAPLTVTCDATDLVAGTYHALLRFTSNDASNPMVDVPVTFEVLPAGSMQSVVLDFENQEDWSLTFDQWTAVDVDGLPTYQFPGGGISFPHSGEAMAFIAFNPATTTPPMTSDPAIQPHSGVRFGGCFDAIPEEPKHNDDWLISPYIPLGLNSSLTLWVKTYSPDYDLELYNILVSTTDMNPASFTVISGDAPLEAPLDWTQVNFDLSAYDGQSVYVAIQCVSDDDLLFMVDDISIDYTVGVPDRPSEVNINVYPNPVHDQLNITSGVKMTQVEIFNQLGQKVYGQVIKDTNFNMSTAGFNAGVYFVKITSDEGIATRKIMIR
jgi:photosystem II stability/assembly factor-like uncharacterized protein